ncbi:MAG: hypothetical protein L0H31_16340 [Nocardioidaceae bacterium]|nr:hypothetical protein [Nocardioidaceae bacterium]
MTATNDPDSRYDRLSDAIATGDYDVVHNSATIRPDYAVGRPPKGQGSGDSRPLAVRLTDEDRQKLADFAERTSQPMSAVIRAAITEYLDRHPAA